MQTSTISQCTKNYQFRSLESWPEHLPAIAWESDLICGFDRSEGSQVLSISSSESTLLQVFQSVYKELTFSEFAQLSKSLGEQAVHFAQAYRIAWNSQNQQLVQSFLKLSLTFQDWCTEKKVAANELAILSSFKEFDAFQKVCDFLVSNQCGKQTGIQILEIAGELILMETSIEDLLSSHLTPEAFLLSLKKRRFPNSSEKDEEQNQWIQSLGWPSSSQSKWVRRGDKAGVEVKLFFSSPLELHKNIIQLQRIEEKWNTQSKLPS